MALSPRLENSNHLCVIFKKAVNNEGQPLAANCGTAAFLSDMIAQTEVHPWRRKGEVEFMQAYAAKIKPPAL